MFYLMFICEPIVNIVQMTIEMYPSDQVADLRAEVTHWYENLQKEQMNQQAQLQEFGQSGRQSGDFPGQIARLLHLLLFVHLQIPLDQMLQTSCCQ